MNGAIARNVSQAAARGARSFASHAGDKPAHVHMPETAMLTANVRTSFLVVGGVCVFLTCNGRALDVQGTHKFVRKGWEYSTYMGIIGGPIVLYLGLSNAPETDSEFFARCVKRVDANGFTRVPALIVSFCPSARRRSPSAAATRSSTSCAALAAPFIRATCTSGCVQPAASLYVGLPSLSLTVCPRVRVNLCVALGTTRRRSASAPRCRRSAYTREQWNGRRRKVNQCEMRLPSPEY